MKRVIIGLSGGVDSSVSALLLKQAGYEVVGLFIKNFDSNLDDTALEDAKKIASDLEIELKVVDLVKENKNYVFDYFVSEYKNGRTPSPCMICNRDIKFKAFLDVAKKFNFDYIATGHYAKIIHSEDNSILAKAKDLKKDQSYFLALMSKDELEHTLFPLADLTKPEVRQIALENGLKTANKKDSMDVCFVGKEKFNEFIKHYIPINKGKMMTLDGTIIKEHDGLQFYTIGQRKGLAIGGLDGFLKEPWFALGKDLAKNILYVGQGYHNEYLYSNSCICNQANFPFIKPNPNKTYEARFRYNGPLKKAKVKIISEDTFQIFYEEERAVTPGQACVIYDGDLCLGGGLIDNVYKEGVKRNY